MSRRQIIISISAGLILIAFLLFILLKNKKNHTIDPLNAIPKSCSIIIRINNFKEIISDIKSNQIWDEIKKISLFNDLEKNICFIDSISRINQTAQELVLNNPSYLSIHPVGRDKINLLYVNNIGAGYLEKRIVNLINHLVDNKASVIERKYEGCIIFDVRFIDEKSANDFSYTFSNGLLLFSFSSILLEDAIRHLNNNNPITQSSGFKQIFDTKGKNVKSNVLINFSNLPKSISSLLSNTYKSRIQSITNLADWCVFDINIKKDNLLLNGFTSINDSTGQILNILKGQNPVKFESDNILPSTVGSFITFSVTDGEKFIKNYTDYLKKEGKHIKYDNKLSEYKKTYNVDILKNFIPLINEEITIAFDNNQSDEKEIYTYVIIKTKSRSNSENVMKEIIEKIARANNTSSSSYCFEYVVDAELKYPIYQINLTNFLSNCFGNLFNCFNKTYFTFEENNIVFGESVNSLSYFIKSNVLNKTLNTNNSYKEFKTYLSPKSNVCFYSNLSLSPSIYRKYLNNNFITNWEENISVFQKIQIFGWQMNFEKNLIYNNLILKTVSETKNKPHTVWETLLDTASVFKPHLVVNYKSNQTEIFTQDLKRNVYLINNAGRILWKLNLSEEIQGNIYQIDYFQNGKLQFLFAGEKYIHLLDRNGNYIEKYPVKLRAEATNTLSLIDYDQTKDYRLFIACDDNNVYCYDKEGTILKGWEFGRTERNVIQPVNHYKAGDKDFITFHDGYKVYILDRRGKTRIEVNQLIPISNNNIYFDEGKEPQSSRFVLSDTSGLVYFINLEGNLTTFNLGKYSSEHFFDFKAMTVNNQKDYIFLDRNELKVFNNKKNKLFGYNFNAIAEEAPVYYQFSASDRKLGIILNDKNLIYLINNNGSLYKGFPLTGCTKYSIGFLENSLQFNLIVGGENNFLYNYIVQ